VGPPGLPTAAKRVAIVLEDSTAKEGHTMTTQFWLELLIIALRIVSAGMAG